MGGKHKGTQFDFADLTRGKKGDQRKDTTMNKEELIKLGISETVANQIMESLNGSFVPKSRFNEINTELAAARSTIKERDTQLETLRKSTGDIDALKKQIADLQSENDKQKKTHDAEMKSLRVGNAVELALKSAGAKNNTAARALMAEFLAKAELADAQARYDTEVSDDGSVKGLDAEIKRLVDGADTGFLFEKLGKYGMNGAKPGEKGDNGSSGMTLEKLRAMSPAERFEFSTKHPDDYKTLYGG